MTKTTHRRLRKWTQVLTGGLSKRTRDKVKFEQDDFDFFFQWFAGVQMHGGVESGEIWLKLTAGCSKTQLTICTQHCTPQPRKRSQVDEHRPHSSLGYQTRSQFAAGLAASAAAWAGPALQRQDQLPCFETD